jgi:Flp pilus assembly protein TadD
MAEIGEAAPAPGNSSSAEAALNEGMALNEKGELEGAEVAFRRAHERGLVEGTVLLGVALARRGEAAQAEACFRSADERGSPDGARNLGVVLQQRGDLAGAETAYRLADERESEGALSGLIQVLVQQAELQKAQEVVSLAVQGPDPGRAFAATYTLARAFRDLNMPRDAAPPARKAVELEPLSVDARVLLATILTMCGQRDDAEATLRTAGEIGAAGHSGTPHPAPAEPQPGEDPESGTRTRAQWPAWLQRVTRTLASLWPFGSKPEVLPDEASKEAIEKLQKLATDITVGFARMIAGHTVTDLPVERAIADRMAIELEPFFFAGYAYRPNFGQYGQIEVTGNLAEEAKIEVTYTDSSVRENKNLKSVRENANYQIIVSRPREIRLTAQVQPPYEIASSCDVIVVHGRPTPAAVLQGLPIESTEEVAPQLLLAVADAQITGGNRCTRAGCQRARLGRSETCLAHIPEPSLREALAEHIGELDASWMTITTELLKIILDSPAVRPLNFEGARFDTVADFSNRLFIEPVSFEFTSFMHGALFIRSTFTHVTSFSGAEFHSEAAFESAHFYGAALLDAVKFREDASFEKCAFHGGASFCNAQFTHAAAFEGCQFRTDVQSAFTNYLCGAVTFSGAVFSEPPGFSPVLVSGVCDFDGANFDGEGLATLNIACSAASFVDTHFAGGADLMLSPCDLILDGANFGGVSSVSTWRNFPFRETREVAAKDPQGRVRLASVRGARIGLLRLEEVDLRACLFDRAHGLDTTRIEGSDVFAEPPRGFRVRRPVVAEEWSWRSYGWRGGPTLKRIGIITSITRPAGSHGWAQIPAECQPPAVLAASLGPISRRKIMAAYHDLRVARENMHDQLNASDYYYSEMQMRGEHDHSSVLNPEKNRSWIELILIRIFWVVSGYDVRPARSLISFAAVIMLGALVLWQWGYRAGTGFGHAVITSLAAATALFGDVDWTLLTSPGQLAEIFLRVSGPILLALTALGIRARARR